MIGVNGIFVEESWEEIVGWRRRGWCHGRGGGVAIGKIGLNGGYGVYRIEEGIGENGACGLGLDGIP